MPATVATTKVSKPDGGLDPVAERRPVGTSTGSREVHVVLAADGSPVAGVEVFHLFPDTVAEALDSAGRRRFFTALGVDHEVALREFGRSTRTDELGVARVPVETGLVVARSGALFGQGMRPRADDEVWTIRLEHDATLEIDVVDATGRPAVGVQVGVGSVQEFDGQSHWLRSRIGSRSDEAGRVNVRHAHRLERRGADRPVSLTPMEPGLEDRFGPVLDFGALPETPLRLLLAPHGSIEAEVVDALGRVLRDCEVEWVFDEAPPAPGEELSSDEARPAVGQVVITTRDGRCRLPWIGLGRRFSIRTRVGEPPVWERLEFDGPRVQNEVVRVTVGEVPGRPVLRGRVLGADGVLPAGERVLWNSRVEGREGSGVLSVTSDGEFAFALGKAQLGLQAELLALRGLDASGFTGEVGYIEWAAPLRAGIQDVGDILLEPAPLVCAGELVGDAGSVTRLDVQTPWSWIYEGELFEGWSDEVGVFRLGDGPRFRFVGRVEPGRLRVVASARDALPIAPVPFDLGAQDLRVEILRGGGITASVTDAIPLGRQVRLVGRAVRVGGRAAGLDEERRLVVDGRAGLDWPSLWPGTYDVSVAVLGCRAPFAVTRGVVVRDGTTTEIGPFELPRTLRTIEVRIVPPEGVGLRGGANVIVLHGDLDGAVEGYVSRPDVAEVLVDAPAVDLLIAAKGCRAQRIDGVTGSIEVVLERAWTRRFTVDLPGLPDGHTCQLGIEVLDAPAGRLRTNGGMGSVAGALGQRGREVPLDGAWTGTADFMVPGSYAVELHVMRKGARRWQRVHGVTPATFEVGDGIDGTVEVRATAAEIAAAIAKLPQGG